MEAQNDLASLFLDLPANGMRCVRLLVKWRFDGKLSRLFCRCLALTEPSYSPASVRNSRRRGWTFIHTHCFCGPMRARHFENKDLVMVLRMRQFFGYKAE
jgi:hypothetical protein